MTIDLNKRTVWGHIDGHEISVLSTCGGIWFLVNKTMPKLWFRATIHRHPIVAMSMVLASIAVTMPIIVVPIRRRLGYPTNQYDAYNPWTVFPKYD
jgi:hypothetical protein